MVALVFLIFSTAEKETKCIIAVFAVVVFTVVLIIYNIYAVLVSGRFSY